MRRTVWSCCGVSAGEQCRIPMSCFLSINTTDQQKHRVRSDKENVRRQSGEPEGIALQVKLPDLDEATFLAEVKKLRGKKKPLTVAGVKTLRQEYARELTPLRRKAAEALALERQISDLVNAAYGLTPDEVALMWQTAPPRMPLAGPR